MLLQTGLDEARKRLAAAYARGFQIEEAAEAAEALTVVKAAAERARLAKIRADVRAGRVMILVNREARTAYVL